MEALTAFALAALALLAAPGPTNALFAAAGAASGLRRAWPLVAVAIAGYGVSITALSVFLDETSGTHPELASALRLAAGIWLIWSAIRLWRGSGPGGDRVVTPVRLLVTTILNPKTLIFASAIFPSAATAGPLWPAVIFAICTAATGVGWIMIGSLLARRAGSAATPRLVGRIAALTLVGFAIWVIGWGLAGLIR